MDQIIYAGKHRLTYSVARHSHASWELIYCTGGSGEVDFDDLSLSLSYRQGDVVVIPPRIPHTNGSETGFTNIHINILHPALTLRNPTLLHDDGQGLLRNAFFGAFWQFSAERGRQTPLLSAYGRLIVCHLNALLETPAYHEIVEEISNAIISGYPDSDFDLEAYLRGLPFSYDYLRKLFKKEIGVTPHRYLNDLRLQVAAQYLAGNQQGGLNVGEISRLCGFREPLYFSRMFKKKYGMSPTAYSVASSGKEREIPDSDSMKIML